MAYVLNANLTDTYIQSLITRNEFTDVTADHEDWNAMYVIQDLNGQLNEFFDMSLLRDWLIQQYVIIQNS